MDKFTRDYFQDNWHKLLWAFCLIFAAKGLHLALTEDWGGWLAFGMGLVAPSLHYLVTRFRK